MRQVILMAAAVMGLGAGPAAGAFVTVRILGEDGTNRATIGPEGGRVPYSIFVETDPVGTPGNLGLAMLGLTLYTGRDGPQLPVMEFGPDFQRWWQLGAGFPIGGDIVGISADQRRTVLAFPPGIKAPEVGQHGPTLFARGEILVPPERPGARFRLFAGDRVAFPFPSTAAVFIDQGARIAIPDEFNSFSLLIVVVPEPATGALLATSLLMLSVGRRVTGRRRPGAALSRTQTPKERHGRAPCRAPMVGLLAMIYVLAPG